jgi:hypothetical protein
MEVKKLIIALHHLDEENIKYHYDWHKRIADMKIVWQTAKRSNNPDWMTIDVPGKIMIPNVMRVLSHYAAKYNYDYYCLMAGDCYILKKYFFDRVIEYMQHKKADVCFTHLNNSQEHYKSLFDPMITRNYKVPQTQIRWSLNICNFLTRKAVKIYNEESHFKIYDESDFPNAFYGKVTTALFPNINYNYFNAADLARVYGGRIKGIKNEKRDVPIIHAVKDYKLLDEYNVKLK